MSSDRKKLRAAREQKGLTQGQVAEYLGYKSKSQYCMVENGQRGVSIGTAIALSNLLEKPIEHLFGAEEVHVAQTMA
ncbi:helix-turn-helix transcriptional regulator [Paenibacillus sp. LHD-117]|uniref:helix-turn-helix transcriptional regulator n=1 Tax=Paenibacillus sp. LHD-117 TaxID=3071412 RepID=UPI0027DF3FE8|nr:helix-turn-helix transcriptional regulator [Paenibacillus sp. LHD-117]MDQ6418703.1 helix-turn-helix transcriptional regulator [Paenibacillus sp. LHD-117]